eukprot:1159834-Pelagomonas_calceolata.AAC.3
MSNYAIHVRTLYDEPASLPLSKRTSEAGLSLQADQRSRVMSEAGLSAKQGYRRKQTSGAGLMLQMPHPSKHRTSAGAGGGHADDTMGTERASLLPGDVEQGLGSGGGMGERGKGGEMERGEEESRGGVEQGLGGGEGKGGEGEGGKGGLCKAPQGPVAESTEEDGQHTAPRGMQGSSNRSGPVGASATQGAAAGGGALVTQGQVGGSGVLFMNGRLTGVRGERIGGPGEGEGSGGAALEVGRGLSSSWGGNRNVGRQAGNVGWDTGTTVVANPLADPMRSRDLLQQPDHTSCFHNSVFQEGPGDAVVPTDKAGHTPSSSDPATSASIAKITALEKEKEAAGGSSHGSGRAAGQECECGGCLPCFSAVCRCCVLLGHASHAPWLYGCMEVLLLNRACCACDTSLLSAMWVRRHYCNTRYTSWLYGGALVDIRKGSIGAGQGLVSGASATNKKRIVMVHAAGTCMPRSQELCAANGTTSHERTGSIPFCKHVGSGRGWS